MTKVAPRRDDRANTFPFSKSNTLPYLVQTNITGLGTVVQGAWQATAITPAFGGTGIANNAGGSLTFGSNAITLTTSGATNLTLPTSGTVTALGNTTTGSGSIALATSPTLVSPALGTPSSGVLTNCTGLPLSSGVTGQLPASNLVLTDITSLGTITNLICGTLRINSPSPTAVTHTVSISSAADSVTNFGHVIAMNFNGVTYYVPCGVSQP